MPGGRRRPPGLLVAEDEDGHAPDTPTGRAHRVTDSGVRLRSAPGTAQPILVRDLGRGTVVTAVDARLEDADGYQWRHVRTPAGVIGWVAAAYLRPAVGAVDPTSNGGLSVEADHDFSIDELLPHVQGAAAEYGTDYQVVAAILAQESGVGSRTVRNWRVHFDGTGHGLIGLDDNGLLPDFERWLGLSCGGGHAAISIPPELQIEYCAKIIADYAGRYGIAYNAARVWHRGLGLWQDGRGQHYEDLIRGHVARLFG